MNAQGLLNDILFKIVFGADTSEPVLLALLNALLGYSGEHKIAELSIVNPTFDKEYLEDKGIILDIRAIDRRGHHYNIEVQLSLDQREAYLKRSLYYAASLLCGQLSRGDDYNRINKTICISLVDFVLFKDTEKLHSTYHLRDMDHGHVLLTDVLELHYIELPKFRPDKPHHLRSPFEKWLYVLKFSDIYVTGDQALPENLQEEEGISMAIDSLRKACADDEVREMIRVREKARKDFATALNAAREEGLQVADQERQKAEQERQRAEQERQKAEQERQKAEQERERAEQAEEKAERLAGRLRELGLDPDL